MMIGFFWSEALALPRLGSTTLEPRPLIPCRTFKGVKVAKIYLFSRPHALEVCRPRYRSHAGAVRYPDGSIKLVVAGGEYENTTEIFTFGAAGWTFGPVIPLEGEIELFGGASVPYKDSFLIAGGYIYGILTKWQVRKTNL